MLKRDFGHSELLAFGAGVAVGCKFSRSSRFLTGILEKLGIDLTELAIDMWDPEGNAIAKKPAKANAGSESPPLQQQSPRNRTHARGPKPERGRLHEEKVLRYSD